MEHYEELLEAIDKLPDLTEEQKNALLLPAKGLNTALGTRGSDLLDIKKQLGLEKEKVVTYSEFAKVAGKLNLKAEDLKALAEKAGIEQTNDETITELKRILKETEGKLGDSEKTLRLGKLEKSMQPKFDEAVKNYRVIIRVQLREDAWKKTKLLIEYKSVCTHNLLLFIFYSLWKL